MKQKSAVRAEITVRQRIFCLCFTGGTAHGPGACPASLYDAICTIQAVLRDIVVSPAVIAALEMRHALLQNQPRRRRFAHAGRSVNEDMLRSHQNCIPIQTPISFSFSASIAPKRNFIQKREDKFPANPNFSLQNGDSIAKFT